MARRDRLDEAALAREDERRDAIDRIAERCKRDGITGSRDVVHLIVSGLDAEMRPLVAVELSDEDPDAGGGR